MSLFKKKEKERKPFKPYKEIDIEKEIKRAEKEESLWEMQILSGIALQKRGGKKSACLS
jgi:hypothetical protein